MSARWDSLFKRDPADSPSLRPQEALRRATSARWSGQLDSSLFMTNEPDSPSLRPLNAKYGQTASFSLGPGITENEEANFPTDPSQNTADLTAFVQNLLQQMQSRFQSMVDAVLVKIDKMANRIEDLEKAVDDVLRDITASENQIEIPAFSSRPLSELR